MVATEHLADSNHQRSSRTRSLRVLVTVLFHVCALMLLLDVFTTAIGLRMGGRETVAISAAVIRYYGLAGFELVKLPGVMLLVGTAVLLNYRWNSMHPVGRYAFATVACFGLLLTAIPVATNLLEIATRL
jgi:hypothetical protein